jgi:HSP20 family protein
MALMRYRRGVRGWDPLADVLEMTDLLGGRVMEWPRLFQRDSEIATAWHPAVDMYEDDGHVFVRMDLPGLTKEEVNISFDGHLLSITGERKEEEKRGDGSCWSKERFSGEFHRHVHVPVEVSTEGLTATIHDGVLEVTLPKTENSKVKKIPIESGEAHK